jgi:hypothetical protein
MKIASFVAAAALLSLAACATPTPYQPKDQSGYGFSDQRLEANRYRIEFRGNSATERAQVENALLYRAADLTVSNGYDYFVTVTRGTDAKSTLVSDGPYYTSPYYFSGRYFSPRFGWRPWYDPFWDQPTSYSQVTRYEASAEILMFKGKKPADDSRAFDAREVKANLQSKLVMPTPPRG